MNRAVLFRARFREISRWASAEPRTGPRNPIATIAGGGEAQVGGERVVKPSRPILA